MTRYAIARRYAPLALLAIVQLVIILLLPSTAPVTRSLQAEGSTADSTDAGSGGAAAGSPSASGGGPESPAAGGGGSVGAPGGGSVSVPGGGKIVSAHRCTGREFDAAIDFYAPPCVTWPGGNNGGATYQGVTAKTVKVVEYLPQSNPAVESIAKAAGLFVSHEQLAAFRGAAEKFINTHYQLYGRKLHIEPVDGQCSITPPDTPCLRNDFRRIIKDYKPYAIIWVVGGCSACFDEMSQERTVNLGGEYFTDAFARARAPYHWDPEQSGSLLNASVGQFWCANLAHKKAEYALHQAGSMNGFTRKLGVIALNDPEMAATVKAAKAELAKCGDSIAAEYYYAADITTAAQQVQAGIAKMRAANVTSIYYLNDIAGPGYFMGAQQDNHYYVENIMSGAGTQDNDKSGQQLQTNPIACPQGPPCPFSTAFGLSTRRYEPLGKDVGARVWHAAGNSGPPPYDFVALQWDYYSMIATLLQAAGPVLTPRNMEAGARALPMVGDARHARRGFPAQSYTWTLDMGMQYWNKDLTSPYNQKAGAWVTVGGRSTLGHWKPGGLGKLPYRG